MTSNYFQQDPWKWKMSWQEHKRSLQSIKFIQIQWSQAPCFPWCLAFVWCLRFSYFLALYPLFSRPMERTRSHGKCWLPKGRLCNTHQPEVGQCGTPQAGPWWFLWSLMSHEIHSINAQVLEHIPCKWHLPWVTGGGRVNSFLLSMILDQLLFCGEMFEYIKLYTFVHICTLYKSILVKYLNTFLSIHARMYFFPFVNGLGEREIQEIHYQGSW